MRINARDCELIEVGSTEEKKFLEENHTQGSARSLVAYGLAYKNELVQLMSFGKPRFNSNYQWEIIRDCTKRNYIVQGGASKLWSHFIKNNEVGSCIVYSYPHNDKLFTQKYIKYCGFDNIKRAKPEKKIYFEGEWEGEYKYIGKSILERHGIDRLLKGSFGKERTNEQILLDLGFKKRYKEGFSPQIDTYFKFGVVFKITDLDTGQFYIGETTIKSKWENGYPGSGRKWRNHYDTHKDHRYEIVPLYFETKNIKNLYEYEVKEIRKYSKLIDGKWKVTDPLCMNVKTEEQSHQIYCPECGAYSNKHKSTCSRYVSKNKCPECGGVPGAHKKSCSKYKPPKSCPECGSKSTHKKTCSKYKEYAKCPECGYYLQSHYHHPTCSHYKPKESCEFCGSTSNIHKKTCPKRKAGKTCPECGGLDNHHRKGCSKYTEAVFKPCSECGAIKGHKKVCSHYTEVKPCLECGGKDGKHKKTCSRYKVKSCPECGGSHGIHTKECSHYIGKRCPECGYLTQSRQHAKTCSHYKERPKCPECGSQTHHKKTCSKYIGR